MSEQFLDSAVADAAGAARAGDYSEARRILWFPETDPSDATIVEAALGLEQAFALHNNRRYDEAFPLLRKADELLQTSSNDLLKLIVQLTLAIEWAFAAADRGDLASARESLETAAAAAESKSAALPQVLPLANQCTALAAQIGAGQALAAGDYDEADRLIGEALESYRRNTELEPWSEEDRRGRAVDHRRLALIFRSLQALQALRIGDFNAAEIALAGTSDEAALLEKDVATAPSATEQAGIGATLALRRAVSGLFTRRLTLDGGKRAFPTDRIPTMTESEFASAILDLREKGQLAGPDGETYVEFQRQIDRERQRIGTVTIGRGNIPVDRSERLFGLGSAVIVAIIGVILIGATDIRDNAGLAAALTALLLVFVLVSLFMAVYGVDRTKKIIPVIGPLLGKVAELFTASGGGGGKEASGAPAKSGGAASADDANSPDPGSAPQPTSDADSTAPDLTARDGR